MKLKQWLNVLRTLLFGDTTDNETQQFCTRSTIGKQGELLARSYLNKLGWRTVDVNIKLGNDELDLLVISPCEKVMAIIEVRTTARTTSSPERTITVKKRVAMLRVARKLHSFAIKHRCALRVDIIAVRLQGKNPRIAHYESVFPVPMTNLLK